MTLKCLGAKVAFMILAFPIFIHLVTDIGRAAEGQHKLEIVPQIPHANAVNAVAFSPDGTHVLSGSEDKTLKLWDVAAYDVLR